MSGVKPAPEKKKEIKKTAPHKRRGSGHRRGKVAISAPLGAVIHVPLPTSFENKNLLDLYVNDSAFREAVDTGRYVYVDGKIVLNSSKCVTYRDGKMELHGVTRETEPHYCLHYAISGRVGRGVAFKRGCGHKKTR